jgi:hypothetical protein
MYAASQCAVQQWQGSPHVSNGFAPKLARTVAKSAP